MLNKISSVIFNTAVVLVATAVALWLTIAGHTLQVGGLLIAMGAILGAVIFGFRLAEGFGPDRLSIWTGPVWSIPSTAPALGKNGAALRKAA